MKLSYSSFIALRYLKGRHKRTPISFNTLISIMGVALGVMTLITVLSVMSGFEHDLKTKILGTNSPIIVMSFGEKGIENVDEALAQVSVHPEVTAVSPFTYSEVMLTTPYGVSGIVLKGIDPDTESTVSELENNMITGTLAGLKDKKEKPGIIIGRELALTLGVSKGDTVNVVSPFGTMTPMGMAPKLREFEVVGIFDTGMYEYDSKMAYITIPDAQDFFGYGDAVTGLSVRVNDMNRTSEVATELQDQLGFPYRVRDWLQMNRNLFSALKLEKLTMFVILVLIIIVASFNIVSTLMMIVMEKAREIAILKSMGATSSGIMKIFMIEGIVIGVIGTTIGVAGGYLLCYILEKTELVQLPADVYYISHLPVLMDPLEVLIISAASMLICFGATLYPSWQAARLDPLEALRYE